MNWIKRLWRGHNVARVVAAKKITRAPLDQQTRLILLICIPCLSITWLALVAAEFSGYFIAFVMLLLLLLASYVMVASKQHAEHQIRTLANLIESMIAGDYSLRGRLQTHQAFQELLKLVNNLADTLAQHKIAARESRVLLEKIMAQMDAMVLAVDEHGVLVMANDSAKRLLLASVANLEQFTLASLPQGALIIDSPAGLIEFNDAQIKGEHFLFKESFLSEGKTHQLYLITQAERLLREKERQTWQSLLRVLSHELNNSLTPIVSISQAMKKKLQAASPMDTAVMNSHAVNTLATNTTALLEGVTIINERAQSLNAFIASYSQLSHLPTPLKSTFELKTSIDHIAALFDDCSINYLPNAEEFNGLTITADKSQLEQVIINLVKNALEAMAHIPRKEIGISCQQEGKYLHLNVIDQGAGITNFSNLFVPFYTTKANGSGIGLTLCRQIMFNHEGMLNLYNNSNGCGVHAVMSLPVSPPFLPSTSSDTKNLTNEFGP